MFELNSDPEVIKYADTPARDLAEVQHRLEQGPLADYKKYGYGRFAVELKETGKVIALIMPENIASIRLAEKLGMTRGPLIHIYDEDAYQYEMML